MKIGHVVGKLGLLLLSTSLTGAQAATFYVSTNGSDANPGTAAQPFRTITHAYSLAGPGTTILVAPGTYTDYTSGWGLHLYGSGTASNPIVLESEVRGGAIINGQFASDRNTCIFVDGSYNVIEGFGITEAPNTGIWVAGNSNEILDNEIYNNGTQGTTDPEGQGIYSDEGTSGNVYDGNYIHDNGYAGSNLDHGLYLCGQNEVVINNVVIRQPACGIQIAGYTTVSNMKVYNNVFAWNGTSGIMVWMAMDGVDIKDNIIYQNGQEGVEFWAATGSGVTIDHNLMSGNAQSYTFTDDGSTCSYTLGTTISSDPLFVNETSSGFDAHLGTGSPAIGAGLNLYAVFTNDMAGAARPATGPWELGAYVYSNAVSTLDLPSVSVAAKTPNASRVGLVDGAFTLTRTGGTNTALTVDYSLGGTAANGTDYAALGASVTIPAGAALATIPIVPLPSPNYVGTETVTLTLAANSAYAAGTPNNATVSIAGNSVPCAIGNAPGHAVKITWKSVVGKIYVVGYKTSLTGETWTSLSGPIKATGSSSSYTDTTATQHLTRYYIVYVTD